MKRKRKVFGRNDLQGVPIVLIGVNILSNYGGRGYKTWEKTANTTALKDSEEIRNSVKLEVANQADNRIELMSCSSKLSLLRNKMT